VSAHAEIWHDLASYRPSRLVSHRTLAHTSHNALTISNQDSSPTCGIQTTTRQPPHAPRNCDILRDPICRADARRRRLCALEPQWLDLKRSGSIWLDLLSGAWPCLPGLQALFCFPPQHHKGRLGCQTSMAAWSRPNLRTATAPLVLHAPRTLPAPPSGLPARFTRLMAIRFRPFLSHCSVGLSHTPLPPPRPPRARFGFLASTPARRGAFCLAPRRHIEARCNAAGPAAARQFSSGRHADLSQDHPGAQGFPLFLAGRVPCWPVGWVRG
jgi:hypothetical protein